MKQFRFTRTTCLIMAMALLLVMLPGPLTVRTPGAVFIRGDANNDGEITLADVIHVAAFLYGAGPTPLPTSDSGDANCDNTVSPLDVVYLINFVLRGGPKPKCPT
jgi:hypothetical protein